MSDTEEQKVCQTCSDFEPQTWRKSLCKNCFHTLEEHSAEMLASEANAVAKEKAEEKTHGKDKEAQSVVGKPSSKKGGDSLVPEGKDVTAKEESKQTEQKELEAVTAKRKYGAARCTGDPNSAWSWAKDLGRGFVKPPKPEPEDAAKESEGSATGTSTSKSAPAKSSPPTTLKPSGKTTTVATTETSSASSSSPSATTTTSSVTADVAPASVSKTKSFASKFESKAAAVSQSKSTSKPSDIRPGSAKVAALTGKLTDTSTVSKTKSKLPPEKVDEPPKLPSKSDTRTPDVKSTETPLKTQKVDSSKAKAEVNIQSDTGLKSNSDNSKDVPSKKISKPSSSGQSKAAPFSKDVLRNTKDSSKRDNTQMETVDKKPVSLQTKQEDTRKDTDKSQSAKSVSEKSSDKTIRQIDNKLATSSTTNTDIRQNECIDENNKLDSKLSTLPDSTPAAGGTTNKSRQPAKITGRSFEDKKLENSETKDHIDATKDSRGEFSDGRCNRSETNVSTSEPKGIEAEDVERKGNIEDENKNESSISVEPTKASGGETSSSSTSNSIIPTNETTTLSDSTHSSFTTQSTTTAENKSEDLKSDSRKDSTTVPSPQDKVKDFEENNENIQQSSSVTISKSASESDRQAICENNVGSPDQQKSIEENRDTVGAKNDIKILQQELKEKDETLSALNQQLSKMEEQVKTLERERDRLQEGLLQTQKDDLEKLLNELRAQLSKMEEQCLRLEKDNQALIDKLHQQEASVKQDQESRGKNSDNVVLEEDLEAAEQELEEVKEENKELQRLIMEMKNEMDEMHDHFREHDHDEFREIQKELDMTAKNCRILQFKLRKAERRNDQIEHDRIQYEEKLRRLQDQFDSQDAKDHIRLLEEELRIAKEVSVRLHDELDVVEDKRNKALEENKHMTELLEHTDKRQFRLEMEIDKLRDIVADLKQQLKEAKAGNNNNNQDSTSDRKVLSSIYTRSID